jgi:hypothetical protein
MGRLSGVGIERRIRHDPDLFFGFRHADFPMLTPE